MKLLTLHNQANSSAYYYPKRIYALKNHFASGLSFVTISMTHSTFHALKIEGALKLSFLATNMNKYYPGLGIKVNILHHKQQ